MKGSHHERNRTQNLKEAIAGEAKARLEYTALAMQAMQEGCPEIAQLFMEAAGAEIHGDLRVPATRLCKTWITNGEDEEIEVMYPGFIRRAENAIRNSWMVRRSDWLDPPKPAAIEEQKRGAHQAKAIVKT